MNNRAKLLLKRMVSFCRPFLFKRLYMRELLWLQCTCLFTIIRILKIGIHNQFRLMQCKVDRIHYGIVNQHAVRKTDLQLLRMHINIHDLRIDINHQNRKRKFMLHHKCMKSVFHRFGDHWIFHITAVYKVNFKITIGTVNHRLSNIAPHGHRRNPAQSASLVLMIHSDQLIRNISAINRINHIQQSAVSKRCQLLAAILYKTKGHFRMRKRLLFNDILNAGSLRLRTF